MRTANSLSTAVAAIVLVMGGVGLVACGPQQQADRMEERVDGKLEDLAAGRKGLTDDLIKLRNDIDAKQLNVEEHLQRTDLSAEQRAEQEVLRTELSEQRGRVELALGQVEGATTDTWNAVRTEGQRTADDVGDWFDRQAEKFDRMTKRDNDQDGH